MPYTWRDIEGSFTCDLDAQTWSFEGAGVVAVANTKQGAITRYFGPASGSILQTWEYGGRHFFFGHVQYLNGRPVAGMVKPMIQGGYGEFDGSVSLFLGTSAAVHITGLLEGDLSGAEVGGSNQGGNG